MKKAKYLDIKRPEILFLSFFGVGFVKFAPGTMGTLASLPIFIIFSICTVPILLMAPLLLFATAAGCYLADNAQKKFECHDPSWIVIDEVLGMGFAWMFLPEFSPLNIAALFILFRLCDILKPFPANIFDQKVRHGVGVILDDVISGVYAGLILRFIFIPFFQSIASS